MAIDLANLPNKTALTLAGTDQIFVNSGGVASDVSVSALTAYVGAAVQPAIDALESDLAAPTGSGLVGYMPAGAGSVAATVQSKLREGVSVKDFGAVGDGVADDTAAIRAAIAHAATIVTGVLVKVYFPAGIYIAQDKVFNPTSYMTGAHFVGDGWFSSVIRFGTLPASAYMFNNEAAEKLAFPVFENLGFEGTTPANYSIGTIPTNAGFLRQWSGGPTQGFKFVNCRFAGFDRLMLCEGTNTASETKFINCKVSHIQNYVLRLNNMQSVNHDFIGTDIENIIGDVFQIGSVGGGSIRMIGGSLIPQSNSVIFRVAGNSSGMNYFDGVRFEMRGNSKLFDGSSGIFNANLTVSKSTIYMTEASGAKEIVTYRSSQTVNFVDSNFESNGQEPMFKGTETAGFGNSGILNFDRCKVPVNLSDKITFTGGFGHATARNCINAVYGAINAEPFMIANDFDLGPNGLCYTTAGGTNSEFLVKRIWMKQASTIWPKSNGASVSVNDLTILLPNGAIIKKIVLRKFASGSSYAPYQILVTNNDKTTAHATSNLADQLYAHSITSDDIYYACGATTNNRTIRVCVTTGTTGVANMASGFGYIEYI